MRRGLCFAAAAAVLKPSGGNCAGLPKNKSRIPEAFCKAGYAAFLHTGTAVKREERTMKEISIREFEGLAIGQAENKARG